MKQNFHIGIMGNLFSGKTTLMQRPRARPLQARPRDAARRRRAARLLRARRQGLAHRRVPGALLPRPRRQHLPHGDRVPPHADDAAARDPPPDDAREPARGRSSSRTGRSSTAPRCSWPRMIDSGEMPAAHAKLYRTLFHQTLRNEHIRLPDLTVYLRTEPDLLERRRAKRAAEGDAYAETITADYLREIHESYEAIAADWKRTLLATRSTPSCRRTPTCSRCRPRSTWTSTPTTCTWRPPRSARRCGGWSPPAGAARKGEARVSERRDGPPARQRGHYAAG